MGIAAAAPVRIFKAALFSVFLSFVLVVPARAEMTEYPRVKLQSLDKVTARTQTFEADVGSTIKYGPIYIKIQTCRKAPPIEEPEAAAFLQIWEITPEGTSKWIFSGWMFKSSPALSAMDHPIYDVWVLDCLEEEEEQAEKSETAEPGPEEVEIRNEDPASQSE